MKELHKRRSTGARILQNHLVVSVDLTRTECLQNNELRRLASAADIVWIEVRYRVLEMASGTGVLGMQSFFRVEEIDERGYRKKSKKKDENDPLLHCVKILNHSFIVFQHNSGLEYFLSSTR